MNPSLPELGVHELVGLAGETWRKADGRQKVHFSTQALGRRAGAHADTIDLRRFRRFVAQVDDLPLDCVLEVKNKEQSVLRARRTHLRLRRKAARPPEAPALLLEPVVPKARPTGRGGSAEGAPT